VYEKVSPFEGIFSKVVLNGKSGLINQIGKEIVPVKYDYIKPFKGMTLVALHSKWGFIDSTGEEIIPPKYESAGDFQEGLAAVQLAGKFGFIDKHGKEVIPFMYDEVYDS
jgi:hypothetical protein